MPAKHISIKWFDHGKSQYILQIYKRGMEFSFVSESNEQCHQFVFCKDFLQTVIFSHIHSMPINLFSFSYDPFKKPISTSKLLLLVRNTSDSDFMCKLQNSCSMLNQFEKKLKMVKTRAFPCENQTAFITASSRWMLSPVMISMFTLLLRVGMTHDLKNSAERTMKSIISGKTKPYQSRDASQLSMSINGIKKILRDGDRKTFGKNMKQNYQGIDVMSIHRSGILSYSTLLNKNGELEKAQA